MLLLYLSCYSFLDLASPQVHPASLTLQLAPALRSNNRQQFTRCVFLDGGGTPFFWVFTRNLFLDSLWATCRQCFSTPHLPHQLLGIQRWLDGCVVSFESLHFHMLAAMQDGYLGCGSDVCYPEIDRSRHYAFGRQFYLSEAPCIQGFYKGFILLYYPMKLYFSVSRMRPQ